MGLNYLPSDINEDFGPVFIDLIFFWALFMCQYIHFIVMYIYFLT